MGCWKHTEQDFPQPGFHGPKRLETLITGRTTPETSEGRTRPVRVRRKRLETLITGRTTPETSEGRTRPVRVRRKRLETEPNLPISRAGADEGAKNPLGISTTRLVRIR